MEGKKKYLVLLLLLLLGFGVVSFAGEDDIPTGGNENDTKTNYEKAEEKVEEVEQNPTEENIDAALDIIEDVEDQTQREELVDRVEDTRPGIDPALQITIVENMIANALSKNDIAAANKYFTDNNVANSTEDLEEGNLKDNLNERIEKIEKILGDTTAPVITGIENGTTTKNDVKLTIEDAIEVTTEVTLNGETVDYKEPFDQEGEYIVTVTDLAHNTSTITFTIDKTAPVVEGLTSGKHYEEFTINVTDDSEFTIEVEEDHKETKEYENNTKFENDGTYKITVTDKAGNSVVIWTAIDNTAPEITLPETLTNTCTKVTVTDKFLNEVKINEDVYTRTDFKSGAYNEYFTFEKELCNADVYEIVAKDKIGNEVSNTLTIDKQEATMNYSSLRVDNNPMISKDGNKYYYLTNGDILEYAIAFNEELKQAPTFNINGKEIPEMVLKLNPKPTYRDNQRIYLYEGKMELKDELNLENGQLNITLTNVYDLAGNETTEEKTLNQTPTSNHRIIVYDSVAPVPTNVSIISRGEGSADKYIKNDEIVRFIVDFDEEITLPENHKEGSFVVEINGKQVHFMRRTQVSGYSYIADYKIPLNESALAEGELTFKITGYTDFTGNIGEPISIATNSKNNKVIYDRTPVRINGIDKETYTYDKVGVTPTTTDTDVKSVELTKNGVVVENYELGTPIVNVGEYKLVVKDKAYNTTEKAFTIEKAQIEFEVNIDSEIEIDGLEHTANIKVLNVEKESDYEIVTSYYIMREDGTYYGPRKEAYAKEFGQYKVKVTVKSKNENYSNSETKYKTFKVVDTNAPRLTITWNELNNKTYVKGEDLSRLIYTVTKDGNTVHTVDSATCQCGNYFSIDSLAKKHGNGEYVVTVVDEGGNTATAKANIDIIKPEVTNINKEFINNEEVKVTLTFSEEIKELEGWTKITETEYTKTYNKEFKNEVITFKDLVSLENTYEFTVDAKSPVVTPSYTETTLEEDKEEFVEPTFVVEEDSKYTKELVNGEVNTHKVGKYELTYRVTDEVGNYTDVNLVVNVVDTQLPLVTGVVDGGHYNTIKTHAVPTISDKNLESIKLVRHSAISDKLDADVTLLFKNGEEILVHGNYTLTAIDKYNNTTVVNFTVDTIAPKVILLDKIDTIRGDILPIIPQIIEENLNEIKVWKNGELIEGYKLGDQLKETANYKIYVNDKAGNEEEVEFKIDNETPQIIMPAGYYVTYPIIVKDETNNIADTIVLKKSENSGIIPIFEKYEVENNLLTEEGEYIIIVYDEAYNVTLTLIAIDKGIPTSNIVNGKSYYEITPKAEDKNLLSVELYKDNDGLFPDKVEGYKHGDKVTEEGNYVLKATDKTLVNTLVVEFTIDRTAPYEINTDNITKTTSALPNKAPLDLTAKAKDTVDGEFDIQPTKIYHNELDKELDKVYTTPEYIGKYTVTYVATDKAGNKTEEKIINIVIEKATYGINYEGKTVEYNGKAFDYKTATIVREDGETVEGEITYTITKDGEKVTEIKDAGDYMITVSSESYENIKDLNVTFKVEPAKLTVSNYDLQKGDNALTIAQALTYTNSKGEKIDNVVAIVVLRNYTGWSKKYYAITDKVRTGKYIYTVTAVTDNYYIEETAEYPTLIEANHIDNNTIKRGEFEF